VRKPNHVLKAVYDARPLRRDREQYLDDSLFRESPFHSLRLQNTRHSNPFRSRALANYENTLFANEMRNMRGREHLPLTDLAGNSLRGQFVFPAHAYSFNPNPRTIGGSTAPDIPMNLKTGLPLNLFGFKGKMPQRFGKNIQEEGVIYGDLNEEDVVQLNKLPLRHDDIREAGRALLPTHHGRLSGRARADKIEEAMRVLMEAEIPPALYNQEMLDLENIYEADNPNLTTPGYMGAYLQPFRQWEQGEGYRVRDLDRQEEMGLISPEQRMLMDDNLGQIDPSGTFYRSEPMDIAMRLLKERVSPEAKRHKLEYDKKYESSPERVKYREELNRERRRRHIMGQGGPDMSHTSQHTIVPEDPHTNRARHFKDKGTLL